MGRGGLIFKLTPEQYAQLGKSLKVVGYNPSLSSLLTQRADGDGLQPDAGDPEAH